MYASNLLEKGVQNTNTVVQKLKPASTKAINPRKKEIKKKQKVVNK